MINAFGPMYAADSFAIHARHFFRALHRRRPVAWFPYDAPHPEAEITADTAEMLANAAHGLAGGPSIGVGEIASVPRIRGVRKIAFVVWEPSLLPPEKRLALQAAGELWTPTEWGKRLLVDNGFDAARIAVVPEGVDVDHFRPRACEERHDRPFRFLCVARWTLRKGVVDVVRAYCREFLSGEPVELALHCGAGTEGYVSALLSHAGISAHPPIIDSPPCSATELVDVYNRCDALVLASKSEGWGLPLFEAMACARPAIVTGYGATGELVHEDIGYPVRVEKMIDVDDPLRFPGAGPYGQWAQPDVAHLQAVMRHVFEHRDEAREKGRRAREETVARWTWDHAAAAACAALGDA